jgi:hypothetical protein
LIRMYKYIANVDWLIAMLNVDQNVHIHVARMYWVITACRDMEEELFR